MNRFEINVSLNGKHFCRIAIPETIEADAFRKARDIRATFGPAFNVTMIKWNDVGKELDISRMRG